MTHPTVLHAVATLWSLLRARQYLAEHRDAGGLSVTPVGPPTRQNPRSRASLDAWSELLREERPDRAALAGAKVTASRAPVDPGVLDADRDAQVAMRDVALMLAHVHRRHPLLWWSPMWDRPQYAGRLVWVVAALSSAPAGVAGEILALIRPVDARIRSITGHGPDVWVPPRSPDCPACRQRMLRVQTSAPDSGRWTLICASEQCWCIGPGEPAAGDGCPCTMPERVAGVRHIWEVDHPLVAAAYVSARYAA